jgi:CheY-specific phosphatase CheX
MTHIFSHFLLIFHYNESIEEARSHIVYNTLLNLHSTAKEKETKGIFISLKHSPHLHNNAHLEHLIKLLDKLSQKMALPVALGDYPKEMFPLLKKLSALTQIKLFHTIQAALLFLNPQTQKKQLSVLLFDDEPNNADALAAQLVKLGYTVTHAKSEEEFYDTASQKTYDMTIAHSSLNLATSTFTVQPTLGLSKELILSLPVFIDTAVDSLVTITGLDAQKVKHGVQKFETQLSENSIIASMKFKGDLMGNFFLIFPKSVAAKALEAMVGESVSPEDTSALMDGIAEVCNIITGTAKTVFSRKKIKILFELPKTSSSLQFAIKDTSDANGIWIEMRISGQPFYMFVVN